MQEIANYLEEIHLPFVGTEIFHELTSEKHLSSCNRFEQIMPMIIKLVTMK